MRFLWAAAQLVVVITNGWGAPHGELRRFVRAVPAIRSGEGWQQVGASVPVAVGENGLAWGRGLHSTGNAGKDEPIKREGDRRSPAGIFRIGPIYGGESELVCVDDPDSPDYNQIVAGRPHLKGEPMSMYRRAVVVAHNQPAKKGAGSCIFLHDGESPTVGCTAMAPAALDRLVDWLRDGTLIVQLPRPVYERLKAKWRLP